MLIKLCYLILILNNNLVVAPETKNNVNIAIIGAGMSGMAAGGKLIELGYNNITIFEASTRFGGRIMSIPYKDGFLQMGAQFINGDKNPIYDIGKYLNVIEDEYADLGHFNEARYFFGNCTVEKKDIQIFKEFIAPLDNKYRSIADKDEEASRIHTPESIYKIDYRRFLKKIKATDKQKNIYDAMSRSFRSYWEFEWASKWSDQSLRNLAEWNDLGDIGVSYSTNKYGYKAIVDYIKKRVPKEKYKFGIRINKIRYDNTGVYLSVNGEEINEKFDHVIVTSALGHLKIYHKMLFEPQLPKYKQKIIETVGFGSSQKIFFIYSKPFWKPQHVSISPLPIKNCNRKGDIDEIESELITFQVVNWSPNVLTAWIAGDGPLKMDELNDMELSEKVTKLFRDMFLNETIPFPEKIIRTKWHKNDLYNGSYSYVSKEQARLKIKHWELSMPVKINGNPRVLFAGEATHHRIFETAIGAYLSGRREAERIHFYHTN
ncbi:Amine oxidase domain-containing protein [Strongyloides ratti]|uniref:Amine oxidase domain-containing protein n=1 Tax=Strongyloides ratti TaxID=34506 RepID=A0A090KX20_STRRB|nr:Amine oxidase domain-containing protein [Strongyloides ratti]CEF61971.1 Amine oxidase domain-containing protein [Strongyloides ratti]